MALRDDNVLRLSNGRRLGYAEYGDTNGDPVFLFHGNPGSRLSWGLLPGSPFRSGLHQQRTLLPFLAGLSIGASRKGSNVRCWSRRRAYFGAV